jgi:RNA polymerase sigma factor (sigma-70 family)
MKVRTPGHGWGVRRPTAVADETRLDAELIDRFVARRDGRAFARLVERHGPLVLGVCRRVLRHEQDAEDAFQATFLVLARKAPHIRRRDALTGWLYKVAYHLAMKVRGSAGRRRQSELQPRFEPATADDRFNWNDLRAALDEELGRLPDRYRVPLVLCCLAGRTRDEAAAHLGWTPGTIKMQLERGRQLLRTRLSRRGLVL